MKKTLLIVIPIILIALLSCDDNSDTEPAGVEEAWTRLADFPKEGRNLGVGFLINEIPYVGMARGTTDTVYSDFWKFDVNVNEWRQIASPPTNTSGSVGFSINGKGYFVSNYLNLNPGPGFQGTRDFWQYDPSTDSWNKRKDYPGDISMFGTTFVVDNKGYLFVGSNFNTNDEKASLWEYDPSTDIWTKKAELPGGPARSSVAVFVIEGKAYLVGGNNHIGHAYDEVWSYNPADNSWTSKKSFPGLGRVAAFGFAFDGKGYIGGGCKEQYDGGGTGVNELWQYEPAGDSWTKLDNYPGDGYYRSITSQDNSYGYVFGGGAAAIKTVDFWRFDPKKL